MTGRQVWEDESGALAERVRLLEALEDLRTLKARYFACVDTRDWAGLRSLFTDDCAFESEFMSSVGNADSFVEMIKALILPGRSVHLGHSPLLTIEDDVTASGTWAMYDRVELDASVERSGWEGCGHYVERYAKVKGHWRISAWRLDRTTLHRLPR